MKNLLLFILMSLCFILQAQRWALIGTHWTYDYEAFSKRGYIECIAEKDTTISGITCTKISVRNMIGYYGIPPTPMSIDSSYREPLFIHTKIDSVFFLKDSDFVLVYSNKAQIGDTIPVTHIVYCTEYEFRAVVDSIDSVSISGIHRRLYKARTITGDSVPFSSIWNPKYVIVVDGVGTINDFLLPNYHCFIEGEYMSLNCYEDTVVGLYKPNPNQDCKYVFSGIDDVNTLQLAVYPNPADDILVIEPENVTNEALINIYDVTGQLQYTIPSSGSQTIIDVGKLSSGIYTLMVQADMRKVVKRIVIH